MECRRRRGEEQDEEQVQSGKQILLVGVPVVDTLERIGIAEQVDIPREMMKQVREIAGNSIRKHTEIHQQQSEQGLYFLHEHPTEAMSWKEGKMREMLDISGTKKGCSVGKEHGSRTVRSWQRE